MANEAYRGGQKGLQAVASAIEALRCDFVAKDDIREAGLEELNGKVDALDQFWMDLQIPGGMKPAVGSTTGDLVLGMGPPTVVSDAVSKERNRIYQLRRKKLVGIYEKHNPEKLAEVDTILRRFKGRESTLFEMLEKKYVLDVAFATERNQRAAEQQRIYDLRRKKLVGIYETHNPEKLAEVDTILERYEGRESLLFELLEKKYTMDVAFATPANRVAAERDRIHQLRRKKLVGIYEKHNPVKLKDVDELLKAYAGRESELFEKLEKKYYAAEVAFSAKAIGASGAVQRVGDLNSQLSKLNAGDDDY
jgi:hypothetical protein